MSKYLDQMKNETIADLIVDNTMLKNSNRVLINQKTLLHKRVQELDEANKMLCQTVNELRQALIMGQSIWTHDGM